MGDGYWQEAAHTGDVFKFTDGAGVSYTITAYQQDYPMPLGKLGWIKGPITITQLDSGIVYIPIGGK
jgi:hypothetical protein